MNKNSIIIVFICFFIIQCSYNAALNRNNRPQRKENPHRNSNKAEPVDNIESQSLVASFKTEIQKFWKAPYVWGGASPNGTDCSGLIVTIYKNACSLSLPHNTQQLFQLGEKIQKKELLFGDLVFFDDGKTLKASHVGLYISNNRFLHASLRDGVTLGRLNKPPYDKQYLGARRMMIQK